MQVLAQLQSTLKLLADPVRLRLCALLARSELAVQELVAITGLQQSRISNHLALLKRAGLVRDRREGTWSFHSLVPPTADGPLSQDLYSATVSRWLDAGEAAADAAALAAVLDQRRQRSREKHDQLAAQWGRRGQDFELGTLRAEILALAWPCPTAVADLGCGTGFLARWLAARGAQVVGVDHSDGMLTAARQLPDAGGVQFRRGELEALPLAAAEVGAAFCNLVWHHLADHDAAAKELFRVLAPGGVVVISDLLPHKADWMRETMGDLRLGLDPELVVAALARAGFQSLVQQPAVDRYRVAAPAADGEARQACFPMFLVRGQKPGTS